ncbi:MAG TPA: MCE family protein [Actinomycetes bacterium]|nr:MCE family protein [Actinomycetes bacterium]
MTSTRADRLQTLRSSMGSAVAAALVVALLAGLVVWLWPGGGTRTARAEFVRAVGLYAGSDVRILGVKVGEVTDVTPDGDRVVVEMTYDDKYSVPADAKAVVVAPSVVSDRYVQLTPVYDGGPKLADDARIGLERTAVPVELDRIFASLNDLNVALGPEGANKDGALSRLLAVGADNLEGEGENINRTMRDFSLAIGTLSDGKEDLFGTLRNLQVFTTALAQSDQEVRAFNNDLASVADQLAAERDELALALKHLATALSEVAAFVKENRANLTTDIEGLADITGTLAKQKDAMAEVLDAGPVALSNLANAYNPSSGTLDTRNNEAQQEDPALYLCSFLTALGEPESVCDDITKVFERRELKPPAFPGGSSGAPDLTLGGILGGSR